MIEKSYKHIARAEYDLRFQAFLTNVMNISNLQPREHYLYRLMDRVAFKDLETAMMETIVDFTQISNDNSNDNDPR